MRQFSSLLFMAAMRSSSSSAMRNSLEARRERGKFGHELAQLAASSGRGAFRPEEKQGEKDEDAASGS